MIVLFFFAFLIGLSIGSFLNVIILRYHKASRFQRDAFRSPDQPWSGVFGGRSYCPHCKKILGFWELIPVASFFVQAGRCRSCHKPISWQYPLVELATGTAFTVIVWQFFQVAQSGFSIFYFLFSIFLYFVFTGLLIIAFVYDFRWGLIPDFASYGIAGLALIRILFSIFYFPDSRFQILDSVINDIFLVVAVFALFYGLWFFSAGRAMGMGDVKLAPAIALFLGWPLGFLAALFSFWLGALYGILVLFRRTGVTMKSEVPFGPFLALGALIALLYGNTIWVWYQHLLF